MLSRAFDPDGTQSTNSYPTRPSEIKFLTVNKMDKRIKERQSELCQTMRELDGEYFEDGDDSDPAVSELQTEIRDLIAVCDKRTRSNFVKKFVGSIPLPLFLPAMKRRSQALLYLEASKVNIKASTNGRKFYGEVTGFAFKSLDELSSLPNFPVENSLWSPEFQLFKTTSPARTNAVLDCSDEEFISWWSKRKTETSSNKSWADLKALCKSIVFIYDDISIEGMKSVSRIDTMEAIVRKTQDMAVMLVKQLSGHPEYARSISIVFGFVVPLVFVLSKIVDGAKHLLRFNDAIMNVKAAQLETPLTELDALIKDAESWLIEFGIELKCLSTLAQTKSDLAGLQAKKNASGLRSLST
ncbi:hypothetical protein A7U60_g352 [Sanghuangporus baumii]|uniref:Uncharacterized protein n=1 Tax=Sanghuangporus baumii TaxID=108892 RepID=A0A9Q5I5T9_SANBA|nr:hypothetical protein A7U60_g352 [Sanghuangporus baumii]